MTALTTPSGSTRPTTPDVADPRFVGRAGEIDVLQRTLSQPSSVVLVEGEAGIGKSRLIHEFLDSTTATAPRRVAVTACPPYRDYHTLGPIVDAFRRYGSSVPARPVSGLAGTLRPLFPEWADDLPPAPEPLGDARAARHRLFRALRELMDRIDLELLVLEDAHWADDSTLEFLLFLTAQEPASRVSLIVTYRPDDVPADSLLVRLSSRLASIRHARISLGALDVDDTARLVSSMFGGEAVSQEFADFLHRHSDGVPLAIEESVRLLRERDDVTVRHGEWVRLSVADLQVPPSIRDAVLERVQRLSPEARQVLFAAAVLAGPAEQAVLAQVAGLSDETGLAALDEAIASGLLVEDDSQATRFRHALMGRAVYESILRPQRRSLHAAAGNALEALRPHPPVPLARHFREARLIDKWARHAEKEAEVAVGSGDHALAITALQDLLMTAIDLAPPIRSRLTCRLADAALFHVEVGDELIEQVVVALRSVLSSSGLTPSQLGEIRSRLGRLLLQRRDYEAGRAELERAIPDLDDNPTVAARAMMSLAWPHGVSRPASENLRWLRRAAELKIGVVSTGDRLSLLHSRATALLHLGRSEGWQVAAGLPAEPTDAEERMPIAVGHLNLGDTALVWGHYDEARRLLDTALRLADEHQFLWIRDIVIGTQAHLDWLVGAWEGLADTVSTFLALDDLDLQVRLEMAFVDGQLCARSGAEHRAHRQLDFVVDQIRDRGIADIPLAATAAAALGRVLLRDGEAVRVLRDTDELWQSIQTTRIWIRATELAPIRVEALLACGETGEAAQVVAAFARGLRGCAAPAPRAALASCRALLLEAQGESGRAATAYARAATAWQRLPRPYDALLARERRARCLLGDGQREPALDLMSTVFGELSDLGARDDADRIARDLRRHGVEVSRPWRGGRRGYGDQLSPREFEVVRLVVAGRTNKEIASALSKSERTVDGQLRSAMRKLKVSSRTALAVKAVETGVVSDLP